MLSVNVVSHRDFLLANQDHQKLFLQLDLRPQQEAARSRPDLAICFVVDTSGSMYEQVTADGENKLDLVIQSLRGILNDDTAFRDEDRLALVQFDSKASVLVPFNDASQRTRLIAAVDRLSEYSGGTAMGDGMRKGLEVLAQESASKRMVVLTDGETFDEEVVREVNEQLLQQHIPVTVIGVGDFNESLLTETADKTQGRLIDIVPDDQNPQAPSVRASDLPKAILGDVRAAAKEVVTDVEISIKTVKNVEINRITRVSPTQTEVDSSSAPYKLGNVSADEHSVFIVECTLPARDAIKMRLAQLGFTYKVPGKDFRGEIPPLDVVVEFTHDEQLAGQINQDVMRWVQQRNVEEMIKKATHYAQQGQAEQAVKTIKLAQNMTQRLGNSVMTQVLDNAIGELNSNKTISVGTQKTMKIGAKTQTMRASDGQLPGGMSEEELRKLTGA